ncbi:DUF1800 domain-containing protein [Altererythrobacter arenosus]|uniref:DUF1800 domain-containing protein n=1 Tax=Altererythrobacter arenosus TaxID=3032592 RepID=A0ABY8FV50_9SPHN|nr:DUF1800 domain-containing protein [Altererythrobacter sp. CAU 1644]WFL78882.1 DUF1800 domain-containing protein [Altererythrobacter sp. CAU 1644]
MRGTTTTAFNRFGLGARPSDHVGGGARDWLLDQLTRFEVQPAALAGLPTRATLVTTFRDYRERVVAARDRQQDAAQMSENPDDPQASENRPRNLGELNGIRMAYIEASNARLASALQSDTPFVERLVHFWANHLAVSADKQPVVPLVGNYEFEAIRPNIMGSYFDLLKAAVLHPAMLLYLDQAQSVGPSSELAERRRSRGGARKIGLNENLAREILELHTLGVRTGYSQSDVTELARALTGWTVAGLRRGPLERLARDAEPGEALFVAALHEPGERTIMGKRYREGAADQSLVILKDLARSPITARHVATKLARHFAADDPPQAMVARLETAYLDSDGDLPALYRALIASPEAWDGVNVKFRSAWDWVVASLRATGIERLPGKRGATAIFQQLGQPIWRPGSPAGWGDTAADWAGPGALMSRVEVAQQLSDRIGSAIDPRAIATWIMPDGFGEATLQAIARAESPSTGLALLLASPEFLRR